ncbi:unnamed protein product, partial [Discosporangium mesarthrocarpum]
MPLLLPEPVTTLLSVREHVHRLSLLQEGVEVEPLTFHGTADISVAGASMVGKTPFSVKVLLDGSGITAVSELTAARMGHFYGQRVTRPSQEAFTVRVADGATTTIKEITYPVHLAIHSGFGPVVLRNKVLAVIPGIDDVLIIGSKTLRDDL